MTKNFLLTILMLNIIASSTSAQTNSNYLLWNAEHKLTVDDFLIKTKELETSASYAQFSLDYQVGGFDFFARNFNKKIKNNFIKSASWIDTTIDFSQTLIYQQTLFNISEIYARQFRKALKENKRKLLTGMTILQQLNEQFTFGFSKRRIDYDSETKSGSNELIQKQWEFQIQKELTELGNFSYDK